MIFNNTQPIKTVINTAPAVEPVSLQDIKEHLLLDSGSFDDNLDPVQSLVPDSYGVVADYTHEGDGVDVLGYSVTVVLSSGENQATGTVDVKIQDSDDNITYTDWTGGAFTQVTTANDNAIQQIAYTGSRQYVRVVAKVLSASCEFGVQITKYASDVTQDNLLTALITAAREYAEGVCQRRYITQTWDGYFDSFPVVNNFIIPYGQVQTVTHLKYTDSGGTETEMTVTTDYIVDSSSDPGRIVLPYGVSWPSFTPYSVNPITIKWVCGYGDTGSDVPAGIRTAIKMMVEDMFNHRDAIHEIISSGTILENKTVMALLWKYRLWTEM